MDFNLRLRINTPTVVHEMVDGEVIIVDFETGNYFSLDRIGAHIWSMIEAQARVGEIHSELSRHYAGRPDEIEEGLGRFVHELIENNLVVPNERCTCASVPAESASARESAEGGRPNFQAPALSKYSDMQELLLLDPIHEVDESGWPSVKTESS